MRADSSKTEDSDEVRLDDDVTTGRDDFPYKVGPDVNGAIIDRRSEVGRVVITGDKTPTRVIPTGPKETGARFIRVKIADGETCMIYGKSTLIYIKPRQS